jgi:glycosyltransferase involved in cell wall biosynthesis
MLQPSTSTNPPKPHVVVLMGTLNGEAYLEQQLDSLEQQEFLNWRLIVSDDGSTDKTLMILRDRQKKWGLSKLEIRTGLAKGFATNFLSLAVDATIKGDYFAFCDQDDYWLPEKISRAIRILSEHAKGVGPKLYCGRAQYVDKTLKSLATSPLFVHPPSFRNALIQSIAGGNTMVFDTNCKKLIEMTGLLDIVSHDWWLYQLVTGASGHVIYDPIPTILYRQHGNNVVGENRSLRGKFKRLSRLLNGSFSGWNDVNIAALVKSKEYLHHETVVILELFVHLRNARIKDRLRLVQVCGLYRQTWQGTFSLMIAAIFKKL